MSLPELYSALADPTRLKVLEMLHDKARPVHELSAAFDISRPAISRHLRVLKEAGLVMELKQGRENVYSFQRGPLKAGISWLERHQAKPLAKAKPVRKPVPRLENIKTARPKSTPHPVAVPPAAPQLSFFDL